MMLSRGILCGVTLVNIVCIKTRNIDSFLLVYQRNVQASFVINSKSEVIFATNMEKDVPSIHYNISVLMEKWKENSA